MPCLCANCRALPASRAATARTVAAPGISRAGCTSAMGAMLAAPRMPKRSGAELMRGWYDAAGSGWSRLAGGGHHAGTPLLARSAPLARAHLGADARQRAVLLGRADPRPLERVLADGARDQGGRARRRERQR